MASGEPDTGRCINEARPRLARCGGWDTTTSDREQVAAVTDVVNVELACLAAGRTHVVVRARVDDTIGDASLQAITFATSFLGEIDLTCDAATTLVTSASLVATQFHDTRERPPHLAALRARSAVILASKDVCLFDDVAATALISDTNESGLPDAGDQFLFGSQPVIDETSWNPTDQGGASSS
ncbi:MAG: hypothetical protein ACJAR2_004244 [Ilumatobacter sp.]